MGLRGMMGDLTLLRPRKIMIRSDRGPDVKRTLMIVLIAATATACTANKELIPIGGSRADGTVELAFDYGMFQKPKVDEQAALRAAREKCSAWGYADAKPFGSFFKQCMGYSGMGCASWRVTVKYQCTGGHVSG